MFLPNIQFALLCSSGACFGYNPLWSWSHEHWEIFADSKGFWLHTLFHLMPTQSEILSLIRILEFALFLDCSTSFSFSHKTRYKNFTGSNVCQYHFKENVLFCFQIRSSPEDAFIDCFIPETAWISCLHIRPTSRSTELTISCPGGIWSSAFALMRFTSASEYSNDRLFRLRPETVVCTNAIYFTNPSAIG